jgi:hypothetical protein
MHIPTPTRDDASFLAAGRGGLNRRMPSLTRGNQNPKPLDRFSPVPQSYKNHCISRSF